MQPLLWAMHWLKLDLKLELKLDLKLHLELQPSSNYTDTNSNPNSYSNNRRSELGGPHKSSKYHDFEHRSQGHSRGRANLW